jgi:hypothetical protein
MNGTLEVSSALGAGSKFTFKLTTEILEKNVVEKLVGTFFLIHLGEKIKKSVETS